MSKSQKEKWSEDDELTFKITTSDDAKQVTLLVISPKSLTGEEYFTALSDFVNDNLEDADKILCNEELSSGNMH